MIKSIVLLSLIAFAKATNQVGTTAFKSLVCQQCDSWCGSDDVIIREPRVGKSGPRGIRGPAGPVGPKGSQGDEGARGPEDPRGEIGPPGVMNMTMIEETIDRKIEKALESLTKTSCANVKLESALSKNETGGVYEIYMPNRKMKKVYCDMRTDGGNWIVFQRRMNGDVGFIRDWNDYVNGFGDLTGDFWLGLEAIHQLTKKGGIELRIDLIRNDGTYLFAKYSNFRIGSSGEKYRLSVSGYSGNATDSFSHVHDGKEFSTKDADNDRNPSQSCANRWKGAWWYNTCGSIYSNLNGLFKKANVDGVSWYDRGRSVWTYMDFTEMKFRVA